MRIVIFLFFIFSAAFCHDVLAQTNDKDAALWMNIYVDKRITKKYSLHLNQQNRFNNNISQYGQGYADIGITRKFNKHFKLMLDYVYIWRKNKNETYGIRHQYYLAVITGTRIRKYNASYRLMLQGQNNMPYFMRENYPVFYLRNKCTLKYQFNKYFTVYLAEELFLPLNNYKVKGLDRSRSFLGMFYTMGRKYELELYFAYQHQLNPIKRRKQDYIYGFGYSFKI